MPETKGKRRQGNETVLSPPVGEGDQKPKGL